MFKKKRETDTLTQQRSSHLCGIFMGSNGSDTADRGGRERRRGGQAEEPARIISIDAVFALLGLFLCEAGFAKAMKLSAEELKEKENLSDKGEEAEDESGGN